MHGASVQSVHEGGWDSYVQAACRWRSGLGFVGHVSSLIGILRRQLSVNLLTGKCPRSLEVRWPTLRLTVNWLNEWIGNNHLQDFLAGRGMTWQSNGDAAASVVWLQLRLLTCALNPVLLRVDAALTRRHSVHDY
jgi:hypothetical protein